jgi:hypothetical protein
MYSTAATGLIPLPGELACPWGTLFPRKAGALEYFYNIFQKITQDAAGQ